MLICTARDATMGFFFFFAFRVGLPATHLFLIFAPDMLVCTSLGKAHGPIY